MTHGKMVTTTKVTKAATNAPTLRTSIPVDYARELGIEEGSILLWELEKRDGKTVMIASKLG